MIRKTIGNKKPSGLMLGFFLISLLLGYLLALVSNPRMDILLPVHMLGL